MLQSVVRRCLFFFAILCVVSSCSVFDSYKYEKRNYWINHKYRNLAYIDTTKTNAKTTSYIIDASIERAKGDYAMAIINYQQALRYDTTAAIYYAIADCYNSLNINELAIEFAIRSINLERSFVPAYEMLAMSYVYVGDYNNAIITVELLIDMQETEERLYVLAQLYDYKNNRKADTIYAKLVDKYNNYRAIENIARKYLVDSLRYDAKLLFKNLSIKNNNWIYPYWLGIFEENNKNHLAALNCFDTAIKLDSNNIDILQLIADINGEIKNYKVSDSIYEQILNKEPNNPIICNNYAYTLCQRKINLDYALKLSQIALDNNPNYAVFLDTYGWVLFQMGDYENARKYIEQSVNLDNNNYETFEHLSDIYLIMENYSAAMEAIDKALEIEPGNSALLQKKTLLQSKINN